LRARQIATHYYYKRGYVPQLLIDIAQATATDEAFLKYSSEQPRVPAGCPEGGQWCDAGENSNNGEGGYTDAIEPVYPIEMLLPALSVRSITTVIRGFYNFSIGTEAGGIIDRATQAIEDYFEGRPARTFSNESGDIILMKGDKKIRFDINNSGNDDAHFHIQKQEPSGAWTDAGNQHRYYFRKDK